MTKIVTPTELKDYTNKALNSLKINEIARIIREDWVKRSGKVHYAAVPYLERMHSLCDINADSKDTIQKFLYTSTTWCGEVARQIKLHLRTICNSPSYIEVITEMHGEKTEYDH